jgi:lysophospholipase L1-like esterase
VQRRTLLRLGASTVALGALVGGGWVQLSRRHRSGRNLRRSATLLGRWERLGAGIFWLLPSLEAAPMVVPDRPHARDEDDDPARRALIRRVRSFTVTTGPERLRNGPFTLQPQPGVFRILALGDSTTFGWGVAQEQAWPAQLEAVLRARGVAVEVINAGVPATDLRAMDAYLRAVAVDLGLHGLIASRRPGEEDAYRSYRTMLGNIQQSVPGLRCMVALAPVGRFDLGGLEQGRSEAARLLGELQGLSTPVLDLTDPFRERQGRRGCDLEVVGDRVRVRRLEDGEVLVEAALGPQDLPEAVYRLLERDLEVGEPLIFDGGHMDAEGNALAAELIAATIDAEGWLG